MATGGAAAELDSRVACGVCLERYRGRQAKLLPCYHTLCSPCLTQLTNPATGQGSGDTGDATSSTVTCPFCRVTHPIPSGRVSALPSDPYAHGGGVADVKVHPPDQQADGDLYSDPSAKVTVHQPDQQADGDLYSDPSAKVTVHQPDQQAGGDLDSDPSAKVTMHSPHQQADGDLYTDPSAKVTVHQPDQQAGGDLDSDPKAKITLQAESMQPDQQAGSDLGSDLDIKVKEQLAVMEAVASRLREEEKEVNRQVKAVELDIHTRYDTGLALLTATRDACLVSLRTAGHQAVSKSQAEGLLVQSAMTSLQQVSQEGSVGLQGQCDHLLSGAAMAHFPHLLSAPRPPPALSYVWSDNTAELGRCLQQFMGVVTPSAGGGDTTPQPPQADSCRELLALRRHVMALQTDLSSLNDKYSADMTSLRDQHKADMTAVKADMTSVNASMTLLSDQQKADLTSLNADMTSFHDQHKLDLSSLGDQLRLDLGTLQTELATVQKIVTQSVQAQRQADTLVAGLKTQIGKLKTSVFFNARLTKNATFTKGSKLILDNVPASIGGGYDPATGVFTATVSGTYLFLATIRGYSGYDCLQETSFHSVFHIKVQDKTVASSWGRGRASSTCHTVVTLTAGHKVWLEAGSESNVCYARGAGYTSFCGLMVQQAM